MWWRQVFGWVFAAGFVLLAWDLLTVGRDEKRPAQAHAELAGA
jgi:nitric oxide reductase subunit B